MVNERQCQRFMTNINSCNLIDLGSEGPRFTWRGPLVNHATILYKKLDWALCNVAWRNLFSEAMVKVGHRIQSDRHSLFIYLQLPRDNIANRPFRFEAVWDKWSGQKEVWKELGDLEKH